ncbi:MAG: hypothetical protein ACRD96_14020, partial [Bryobacteraceae bacterium]
MRRRILAAVAAVLLALAVSTVLALRSDWLRQRVHERIVSEIERSTGGRASLGGFDFDWKLLRVELRDLVVRGKEPEQAAPLARVTRVQIDLRVISFFRRHVDVAAVLVESPAVNLIVNEDGATNVPEPKVKSPRTVAETILNLAVKRFAIEGGAVTCGMKRYAVDARGENLRAQFQFEPRGPKYGGTISLAKLVAGGWKDPIAASASLGMERNRL